MMTSPGQGFNEKMAWSVSADPRRRQFEVKRGENEALKREIVDIENKRVEEHRDLTSDVSRKIISDIGFLFYFVLNFSLQGWSGAGAPDEGSAHW